MTDINRLIASIKRRSAHAKEFGDEVTFVKLEDLNALVAVIEKSKEASGCPSGVDLQDWVKKLAAENVALKAIVDSVTDLSNEPQYHYEGMGCGLEDRGITDRYEAMQYGWDEAMERVYGEVIPCAEELDFSATDRIVAGIKADGAKAAGDYLKQEAQHMPVVERLMMQDAAEICYGTAAMLREGADK
ncbi:hypothetical protein [Klebsiella aerogenes]|uniref:hypothetical protein n=1 Tax=Klebsiella aerogenes TaxID=548 RepID=UPI0039C418B0